MMQAITRFVYWLFNVKSVQLDTDTFDPVEAEPGLHVIADFGADHALASAAPDEQIIARTMSRLDWERSFYQVVLVRSSGESLEVGGSLDPQHGLSGTYRDPASGTHLVTPEPPASVEAMTSILSSFSAGTDTWRRAFAGE